MKSLVFLAGDGVVIVLLSGADRVDEAKLSAALQAPQARRATAKEVRDRTGFAVGGVPPFGHGPSVRVVFDHALLGYDTVWAAAGLPDAVFSSPPAELARASGAVVADVRI